MLDVLRARGVHSKLVALIADLYTDNTARAHANGAYSAPFPTSCGVRQGCAASPLLFNTVMDFVCRAVLAECEAEGIQGIRVGYRIDGMLTAPPRPCSDFLAVLMLLYADDVCLLCSTEQELKHALEVFERVSAKWGLRLNYDKTKVMVVAAGQAQPDTQPSSQPGFQQVVAEKRPPLALQRGSVGWVSHYKYLGSEVEEYMQQERELARRISLASETFRKLHKVLRCAQVSLKAKMDVYKTIVLPMLLYGAAESWAPTEAQTQRLDVFHTRCLRRMLGVTVLDISNSELFERTGARPVSAILREYRLRWLGHVARREDSRWVKQLLFAHEMPGHHAG